jgi:hypothetical protein
MVFMSLLFIVAYEPGAKLVNTNHLDLSGKSNVKGTRIDDQGNLLIETDFGELMHKRPDIIGGMK